MNVLKRFKALEKSFDNPRHRTLVKMLLLLSKYYELFHFKQVIVLSIELFHRSHISFHFPLVLGFLPHWSLPTDEILQQWMGYLLEMCELH